MEKVIVCFGDSNTWGYNALNSTRFNKNIRFPRVIENMLNELSIDNTNYKVIEEGLCGRTFVFNDPINEGLSGIKYIKPCLQSHSPIDLLIIMLGTNDTKERFSATPRNIAQGAQMLIDKAKSLPVFKNNSPNILLIAPPRIKEQYNNCEVALTMGKACDEKSIKLIKELELVAKNSKCHFLNSDEFLEMNDIDYMHLDEKNHFILAQKLVDTILKII